MMHRGQRSGSRPGAGRALAGDELPHRVRGELTPFDSDTAPGPAHDIGRKPHRAAGAWTALRERDFHRPARRCVALRAHERSARADVLERPCHWRRGARGQLHGQTHLDALAPSMLHDRLSPQRAGSSIMRSSHPRKSAFQHRASISAAAAIPSAASRTRRHRAPRHRVRAGRDRGHGGPSRTAATATSYARSSRMR